MFCKEKNKTAHYILIALLVISVITNIWFIYQICISTPLPPANTLPSPQQILEGVWR